MNRELLEQYRGTPLEFLLSYQNDKYELAAFMVSTDTGVKICTRLQIPQVRYVEKVWDGIFTESDFYEWVKQAEIKMQSRELYTPPKKTYE